MTLNEAVLRAAVDAYAATAPDSTEREAAWEAVIDLQARLVAAFVLDEITARRLLRGPHYYERSDHPTEH